MGLAVASGKRVSHFPSKGRCQKNAALKIVDTGQNEESFWHKMNQKVRDSLNGNKQGHKEQMHAGTRKQAQ